MKFAQLRIGSNLHNHLQLKLFRQNKWIFLGIFVFLHFVLCAFCKKITPFLRSNVFSFCIFMNNYSIWFTEFPHFRLIFRFLCVYYFDKNSKLSVKLHCFTDSFELNICSFSRFFVKIYSRYPCFFC